MNPDLQPTLTGPTITLRPLVAGDLEDLHQAAADPAIWAQHPDSERYRRDVFEINFFAGALACGGALVAVNNRSGALLGSSRYYDWDPGTREIAVGYTFLVRDCWGTGTNTEMKALMLGHAFGFASAVWFHIGSDNLRSRRAIEKLGAALVREEQAPLNGGSFTRLFYVLEPSRAILPTAGDAGTGPR